MKKYLISLLLLPFVFCFTFSAVVSADDTLTVRIGIYENYPKIFTDTSGNPSGFWGDIIEYMYGIFQGMNNRGVDNQPNYRNGNNNNDKKGSYIKISLTLAYTADSRQRHFEVIGK